MKCSSPIRGIGILAIGIFGIGIFGPLLTHSVRPPPHSPCATLSTLHANNPASTPHFLSLFSFFTNMAFRKRFFFFFSLVLACISFAYVFLDGDDSTFSAPCHVCFIRAALGLHPIREHHEQQHGDYFLVKFSTGRTNGERHHRYAVVYDSRRLHYLYHVRNQRIY